MHLETELHRAPLKFARRLKLLIALGYAYFVASILLGTLCLVAALWLSLKGDLSEAVIPLLLGLATLPLIMAFPYKASRPEGVAVTREQAPRLHDMVGEVADALGIPVPDQILIYGEFNAFAAQRTTIDKQLSRRTYNYIGIGLPFMLASTPEFVKSTVAHELGHLLGNDGCTAQRISHVTSLWNRVLERSMRLRIANFHLAGSAAFYQWYIPLLTAYIVTLSRKQELDADQAAVRICSPGTGASGLVNTFLRNRYFRTTAREQFWRQARHSPLPLPGWYAHISGELRSSGWKLNAGPALCDALLAETRAWHTHPCLYDRLVSMQNLHDVVSMNAVDDNLCPLQAILESYMPAERGAAIKHVTVPVIIEQDAATYYLQQDRDRVQNILETQWISEAKRDWVKRHEEYSCSIRCLERLKCQMSRGLTNWQKGSLAVTKSFVDGLDAAVPLLSAAAQLPETNPLVLFQLGSALIAADNVAGEELLQRAMQDDIERIPAATKLISAFYKRRNQADMVAEVEKFATSWSGEITRQSKARRSVQPGDLRRSASISEDSAAHICDEAKGYPEIRAVVISEKCVQQTPNAWVLQVAVEFTRRMEAAKAQRMCSLLQMSIAMERCSYFVHIRGDDRASLRHIHKHGTSIYIAKSKYAPKLP
jgi:Zn-dependent protease with chaperone function